MASRTHDGHRQLELATGTLPELAPTNDVRQSGEFMELHVVTKNVQSIRSDARFEDFLLELAAHEFDIFCFCETWRKEDKQIIQTLCGHKHFLGGRRTPLWSWNLLVSFFVGQMSGFVFLRVWSSVVLCEI